VIFAILLIPSLLASWFCYWFATVFPSLSNRTSKIICVACPFVLAILLAVIFSVTDAGTDSFFEIHHYPGMKLGAPFVGIAAVLVIPTLLLAFAAAKPSNPSRGGENRQV
jgi:hypothetical protein